MRLPEALTGYCCVIPPASMPSQRNGTKGRRQKNQRIIPKTRNSENQTPLDIGRVCVLLLLFLLAMIVNLSSSFVINRRFIEINRYWKKRVRQSCSSEIQSFFVCSEVRCQANRLDSSFPRSKQVQESVWHLPRQRHPGGSRVEVGREIKREFVYSLVISLVISLGGAA